MENQQKHLMNGCEKKIKVKTIFTRKIDIKSIIQFPSTDLFILWKDFYLF